MLPEPNANARDCGHMMVARGMMSFILLSMGAAALRRPPMTLWCKKWVWEKEHSCVVKKQIMKLIICKC